MLRFFFLLLAFASSVHAQETMLRQVFDPGTDTHVEIVALFSKPSPGGYFPVRVKIANNLNVNQSIRLDFESNSGYAESLMTRTRFDLGAAPGKTVTRDLLVPLCPPLGWGNTNLLTLKLSGSLGESANSVQSSPRPNQPAVLLSEVLYTPNASTLDSAINSKFSSSYGGKAEFAAKFDPKQLPDDWLAFSGYDSVVMTDADWTHVPPGGRNAILSWVRLGGQLLVYAQGGATPGALGLPDEAGFGTIEILPMNTPAIPPKALVEEVCASPNIPRQSSIRMDYDGKWPLQKYFGPQTFRYTMLMAVLLVFAILVGPVNLFVFAKSGRRHRLFITTPLISLGTSLVLIAIIIIQDGFGGSGMRRVLMEVRPDAGVNAAFVHQEQFTRTGVLTGSGFTLSQTAVFCPVPITESRWARFTNSGGAKGNFNLEPDDGKLKASGEWFQSRSEHGHVLSAVIPTRGRIETTDTPGSLLSTFDYPLETFFYLGPDGQWFRAEGVKAGKRFALTAVNGVIVEDSLKKEIAAYGERDSAMLKRVSRRPGHFIALTNHAPGIDTHPGIRWKETRTVITGPVATP